MEFLSHAIKFRGKYDDQHRLIIIIIQIQGYVQYKVQLNLDNYSIVD